MRQMSKDGKMWFEADDTGKVSIGLTSACIAELDECWHILPASTRVQIKEGQPLLSVETNEVMFSLPSPVSGLVTFFDNVAITMPDKLSPDVAICKVNTKAEEKKAAKKKDLLDLWIEDEPNWPAAPQEIQPATRRINTRGLAGLQAQQAVFQGVVPPPPPPRLTAVQMEQANQFARIWNGALVNPTEANRRAAMQSNVHWNVIAGQWEVAN